MTTRTTDSPTNSPETPAITESGNSVEHPAGTPSAGPSKAPETPSQGPETSPETPVKALVDDDDGDQVQGDDQAAELATLTAERDELRLQVARLTVAAETGVPADLLRGQDEDELREHAEALVAYAGARATPDFGAGVRGHVEVPDPDPVRNIFTRR